MTLIPGFAGWYLLRRRPLKRIRAIQAQAELIVAGDLTHRLPLSARRDELCEFFALHEMTFIPVA